MLSDIFSRQKNRCLPLPHVVFKIDLLTELKNHRSDVAHAASNYLYKLFHNIIFQTIRIPYLQHHKLLINLQNTSEACYDLESCFTIYYSLLCLLSKGLAP